MGFLPLNQKGRGDVIQGTLDMLILRIIARGSMHEYAVAVERRSDDELRVEEGALYPALHRLELAPRILLLVALIAAYIPARLAALPDPIRALRFE